MLLTQRPGPIYYQQQCSQAVIQEMVSDGANNLAMGQNGNGAHDAGGAQGLVMGLSLLVMGLKL